MPQHIVIIGNGIAGITCARNIRKQGNDDITVISSETEHFYSRTALMYIFMGHMPRNVVATTRISRGSCERAGRAMRRRNAAMRTPALNRM